MVTEVDEGQVGAQGGELPRADGTNTARGGGIVGGVMSNVGGVMSGVGGNMGGVGGNMGGIGGVGGGMGGVGMQSARGIGRDRWGDIYANVPVKRMVALYDYDPQELSPNVDAEVCFIQILLQIHIFNI